MVSSVCVCPFVVYRLNRFAHALSTIKFQGHGHGSLRLKLLKISFSAYYPNKNLMQGQSHECEGQRSRPPRSRSLGSKSKKLGEVYFHHRHAEGATCGRFHSNSSWAQCKKHNYYSAAIICGCDVLTLVFSYKNGLWHRNLYENWWIFTDGTHDQNLPFIYLFTNSYLTIEPVKLGDIFYQICVRIFVTHWWWNNIKKKTWKHYR